MRASLTNEQLKELRETLEELNIDLSKEVIEQSSDSCNQVICNSANPYAGYSIRDLLTIWQHETGQKFKETKDDYE